MGLFKRIHRVTVARIESFMRVVEDPEAVFPQLVREMEQQVKAAAEAEAQAAAAVKAAERDVNRNNEKAVRLYRGAKLALQQGDQQTAREAVEAHIDLERAAARAEENLEVATAMQDTARSARIKVQAELDELRAKKDEILTRARVAKTRQDIQRSVGGFTGSPDSILDAVARLESAVETAEAELEIQSELAGQAHISASLEHRLAELDREGAVEERMEQLRAELAEGEGSEID